MVVGEDSFNESGVPGFQSFGVRVDAERGYRYRPLYQQVLGHDGKSYNACNDARRIEEGVQGSMFVYMNGGLGTSCRCLQRGMKLLSRVPTECMVT